MQDSLDDRIDSLDDSRRIRYPRGQMYNVSSNLVILAPRFNLLLHFRMMENQDGIMDVREL